MAKIIDITEKLGFEEKPKLLIKGQEFEVTNDAATVLKVIDLVGDDTPSVKNMQQAICLLLGKKGSEAIAAMMPFSDYMTVIHAVLNLATGQEDEAEGGADPTTT